MMAVYLGIDIGATKSQALIIDDTGEAVGFGHTGSGNYEVVGWDGFRNVLEEITSIAIRRAEISKDEICGAGFGIAGYDWPSERKPIQEAIEYLSLPCPYEVVNDTIIGLKAGSTHGWGIGIVAGTGENCWGVDASMRFGRMTGNSIFMDEYGGAGSITFKAIHAVARQWGRRGPKTMLSEIFLDLTNSKTLDDFLELVAMNRKMLGAEVAPQVFKAAQLGDVVALEIIRWAANGLADMVLGVSRQLDLLDKSFEVIMIGSTFRGGLLLIEPFKETVLNKASGAKFIHLDAPPVIGGVLLGMECTGRDGYSLRERISRSTTHLLNSVSHRSG